MNHPSFDIIGSNGNALAGKTIIICITGSVAAVKSSEISRELMRLGANVIPVMSPSAMKLIHPDLLHWATGNQPITELTGAIEHVAIAGNVPQPGDLILVAPSTANTISKIAYGIDDTTVTTVATTGLGQGIPMIIVPAMHESMYNHPILKDNLLRLEAYGIEILKGSVEEGKAKIASTLQIVDAVVKKLSIKGLFTGKRVVITAGRTVEYLDSVRVLTNNSTGKMGVALAKNAQLMGANVELIYGKGTAEPPAGIKVTQVETAKEMETAVIKALESKTDLFLGAAAVGDWMPKSRATEKISTDKGSLTLELVPTPKIIDQIKKISKNTFLVAFRAQTGLSEKDFALDALNRMKKADADMIAANFTDRPGQGFEADNNSYLVLTRSGETINLPLESKNEIAKKLLALIAERM